MGYQQVHQMDPLQRVNMKHNLVQIPIRLYVNDQPAIQKSCKNHPSTEWTLGTLLTKWLPRHFTIIVNQEGGEEKDMVVIVKSTVLDWKSCGLYKPALDTK